jgi:hypothetical protein
LWSTVEDPEAATDLRAAAARVLTRVDPTVRKRIDVAIAATHDARDEKRIRLALEDDVEYAASKLEALER